MKIGDREIGPDHEPYTIAEVSCNHGGKLENAIKLIKLAKKAGASAVKTQCYTADTITLKMNKPDFILQDGIWKGRTLWDLYNAAHTPFEWHRDLYQCASDEGITIFSSVFDFSSVDYLEKLGCPAYKIASMECSDPVLIEYAAKTGKPLIISTGMATQQEISEALGAAPNAAFLHCMSEYPGTIETSNLGSIKKLIQMMPLNVVGISDHTAGSLIPIAAVAVGACIIEKHLGHLPGVKSEDDQFSMTGSEFHQMVRDVRQTYYAMMQIDPKDSSSRQVRRSLYAVQDIKQGERFTKDNIRSIRPGYGLPPNLYPVLLGKKARRDYRKGDALM